MRAFGSNGWPQCTQVLALTILLRVRAAALNRCWFQTDSKQSTFRKTGGLQFKLGSTLWLLVDEIDATRKQSTLARKPWSIHASVHGCALLTRVNRWLG